MKSESRKSEAAAPKNDHAKPRRRFRLLTWLYRRVRGLLALGMLTILLLVFTPAATWLEEALDVTQPPQPADYIVCLGGHDERLIWSAELFKQGFAPNIIVSNNGGAALAMRKRIEDMGVPADRILVDSSSRTTGDHPAAIAALPNVDRTAQRFLLVTHLEHSRRAAACFRRGGYRHFTVFAGRPTSNMEGPATAQGWRERFAEFPHLAYEYAGLLQYWLQGKI
jgi:uncharacterized SAM-binding protein YcdF (DUF218 family)